MVGVDSAARLNWGRVIRGGGLGGREATAVDMRDWYLLLACSLCRQNCHTLLINGLTQLRGKHMFNARDSASGKFIQVVISIL